MDNRWYTQTDWLLGSGLDVSWYCGVHVEATQLQWLQAPVQYQPWPELPAREQKAALLAVQAVQATLGRSYNLLTAFSIGGRQRSAHQCMGSAGLLPGLEMGRQAALTASRWLETGPAPLVLLDVA